MADKILEELIAAARQRRMTRSERREQSVSFVIGNENVDGDALSRATVTVIVPRAEDDGVNRARNIGDSE
jgi:hypothetical protein